MKQRVVMVLSTLLDPSLLIADELTSALDVSTQKAVAEMLVEFRDREFVKSTIVITHDLVDPLPDRRHDPRHVRRASSSRRRRRPRSRRAPTHPYTQLLLASLPEVGVRFADEAPDGHPGPAAVAPAAADRMPVPRPLPARVREVRRGAAVRRGRARALRRLLEGGRLMLDSTDVTKVYKTGTFGRTHVPGRLGRDLRHRARRGRLADRRERQRQDDRRPDDPRPDPADAPARSPSTAWTWRPSGRRALRALLRRPCRGSSRTRSARTTRSSRSTACSR